MNTPVTMPLLALDCSFGGVGLGVQTARGVCTRTVQQARASDQLLPLLAEVLDEAQLPATQLAQIILTVGPGSFTGIRLGLAVAQALKLAQPNLHIGAIATLDALAHQVIRQNQPQTPFTLLLDAAGGQVYRQDFTPDAQPLTPPVCQPMPAAAQLQPFVAVQTGLLPPFPTHATLALVNPEVLLTLADKATLPPQPVYLKPLTYKKVGA